MHVTVLDVEGVENQVEETGEDGAVLACRGDGVGVALEDLHCGWNVFHYNSF